ncbi:hypothetical protein T484DRAFT_1821811 [Baffinella frigidus]|nr:hypothetical protein T484DRAFT_1821811 [Cryptophyta sp. CCMP2293]
MSPDFRRPLVYIRQSGIVEMGFARNRGQGGFGLLAYGLWLQVLVAPAPQAGWSKGVDKVFGKWIFLTTQSLFMLTGYFLVNVAHESSLLLGLRSARLQRLAYWLSPVAGGFGIFLTMMFYLMAWSSKAFRINSMMFYLMVWSSKAFQLNSVQFWHDRGLPFAYWQVLPSSKGSN